MSTSSLRTIITLPRDLVAAADEAVQRGKARNRNELVRDDAEYQAEAAAIMAEFRDADWEALQAEAESHGWKCAEKYMVRV